MTPPIEPAAVPDTVHALFQRSARRRPEADFLCTESVTAASYGLHPGTQSWAEAAHEVEGLRQAYRQAGYGLGHRVGLLLENRPAFFHHWLALNALGASVLPIHADLRSAELAYLLGHSEAVLVQALGGRVAGLREVAAAEGLAVQVRDWQDSSPLPPAPTPARSGLPDARTECALLYTSGTTGRPKGCRLSNGYFLAAGRWYAALPGLCRIRPDEERVITPLPLNHMNAMAFSAMLVLQAGGCLVQLDRFHPATWWQSVRESGASIAHYLGVMPAMLLAAPERADDAQTALRFGFGAGVDPEHHARFEQRFGFPLIEAWAMTETGAAACVIASQEPRHVGERVFGRPAEAMQWRLVDEQGAEVVPGQPGELLVRAAGPDPRADFFGGYLKDAEATDEAWAGGWFHTGDLVRCLPDGSLAFVDRRKNLIRRSGENIAAVEVESVLNQHPAVQASAVAATPDAVRGDEVLACIVSREPLDEAGRAALAADLVAHALQRLAYYKAPGYVAFVPALPLTASQKIQRGELRSLAQALPGQAHCLDLRHLKRRQ
ncbi:MAG: AMP-binding protein [Curvibacter sp.]|nr:AMP-binding protein [Curvibacter sp.]